MEIKMELNKNILLEYDEYRKHLLKLSKDEIILQSYKTHIYNELIYFFQADAYSYNDLSEEEYAELIKIKDKDYNGKNKMLEFIFNDISARDSDPVSNYGTTLEYIRNLIEENNV